MTPDTTGYIVASVRACPYVEELRMDPPSKGIRLYTDCEAACRDPINDQNEPRECYVSVINEFP